MRDAGADLRMPTCLHIRRVLVAMIPRRSVGSLTAWGDWPRWGRAPATSAAAAVIDAARVTNDRRECLLLSTCVPPVEYMVPQWEARRYWRHLSHSRVR